jgi:hypothetical protein
MCQQPRPASRSHDEVIGARCSIASLVSLTVYVMTGPSHGFGEAAWAAPPLLPVVSEEITTAYMATTVCARPSINQS